MSNSAFNFQLSLLGQPTTASGTAASSDTQTQSTSSLQIGDLLALSGTGLGPALTAPTPPALPTDLLAVPALPAAPSLPELAVPTLPVLPTDLLSLPSLPALAIPSLPTGPGGTPGTGEVGLFDPLVSLLANTDVVVGLLNGVAEGLGLSPVTPSTNGPLQPVELLVNGGVLAPLADVAARVLDPVLGAGAADGIVTPVASQVSNLLDSVDALLANAPLSPITLPLDALPLSASQGDGGGTLDGGSLTAALQGINSTSGLLSLLPALPVAALA